MLGFKLSIHEVVPFDVIISVCSTHKKQTKKRKKDKKNENQKKKAKKKNKKMNKRLIQLFSFILWEYFNFC